MQPLLEESRSEPRLVRKYSLLKTKIHAGTALEHQSMLEEVELSFVERKGNFVKAA
jgi:hypothetical protein